MLNLKFSPFHPFMFSFLPIALGFDRSCEFWQWRNFGYLPWFWLAGNPWWSRKQGCFNSGIQYTLLNPSMVQESSFNRNRLMNLLWKLDLTIQTVYTTSSCHLTCSTSINYNIENIRKVIRRWKSFKYFLAHVFCKDKHHSLQIC